MLRSVLTSKIHRAYVTGTELDYIGSIFIDQDLMDHCGMWQHEKVLICNVDNGARWETYAMAAEPGSGTVSVQGPGARLCEVGHCLIILSFGLTGKPVEPKMILIDKQNRFVDYLDDADRLSEELLEAIRYSTTTTPRRFTTPKTPFTGRSGTHVLDPGCRNVAVPRIRLPFFCQNNARNHD